jgi:hypothetical protein
VTASLIIRKLASYPRQNSLHTALRESGASSALFSCLSGRKTLICAGVSRVARIRNVDRLDIDDFFEARRHADVYIALLTSWFVGAYVVPANKISIRY